MTPTDLEIGFSGTRRGMSSRQKSRVFYLLNHFQPVRVHHGDCVGADEQFGKIAYRLHIPIVLHPPSAEALRAHCERGTTAGGIVEVRDPADYLKRDRAIVKATQLLIAAPLGQGKTRNGGTWYTVKYAMKKKRDYVICYTNGDMDLSRGDLFPHG